MVPLELQAPLQSSDIISGTAGTVLFLLLLSLVGAQLAGRWAVFSKAGHAGWKAVIPVYNLYVMLQIGENGWWWLVLLFVPFVNFYAVYRIHAGVAQSFGRGIGFGLGLAFFGILFFPLMGFGDYQYRNASQLA
jgi:hypothetical protein